MDVTFIISAVIFTLFAIVVATTALFTKSSGSKSTSRETAAGGGGGLVDRPVHNVPAGQRKQAALSTDRRSSQDHLCEESQPDPLTEEWGTTTIEQQSTTSTTLSSGQEPASSLAAEELGTAPPTTTAAAVTAEQSTSTQPACSLDLVDSSSAWSERDWSSPGGRGQGSYIGLSDTELLKCAFSHPQADGPPESLGLLDDTEFKYIPGAVRTQQMQSMMSKDELEEERRVQREQLAAIFQLLKDNQETFGEVSEGDMEQQLKLYSI